MRAKGIKRNDKKNGASRNSKGMSANARPQDRAMLGRASKLLGRAGATQLHRDGLKSPKRQRLEGMSEERGNDKSDIKPPESFVFEGYRAKSNQGNAGLKLGGSGKRKGKPRNRGAKRAAAWKASGGNK
jgi:nucleolar protein 12